MTDLMRVLYKLCLVLICVNIITAFDSCFNLEENYKCRLSTMTPYRLIGNRNDSELQYPGCQPKKIWLLIRHGTRYPGKKWTNRMMKKLPVIWELLLKSHSLSQGTLDEETVDLFKKWKFRFSREDIMKLAQEGERELINIAERYQSRFPSIMPETYSNQTYKFKYTATQRTEESAKHFALGLFGRKQSLNVYYPESEHMDPILRFYKRCNRWRREVDDNPESYKEKEKFVESPVVKDLINDVSERVGFQVDYGRVHLIYMMCAFETAWSVNHESPWCKLLTPKNFKVLEFAQDLQYYWIDGYGYSLTHEQSCIAMKDVFDFFESQDEVTTRAYFTHSGALLKMLAFLGLAKDEQILKHDSFNMKDDRAWRTSLIDSFATNIAFVLYDCKVEGPGIVFMHQERVVQLEGCPANRPCRLSIMQEKYPDREAECQFDKMCENET